MKNINDFYEGLLANIDDTINKGESDIAKFRYNEMLSMFNIDKKAKYDDVITIIGDNDSPLRTEEKKEIINKCCEYDGNILTIDLDKIQHGYKYSVVMLLSGKSKKLPPVKILCHVDRLPSKISPSIHIPSMVRVNIIGNVSNKGIDINNYIHQYSKFESLTINSGTDSGLETNEIKFKVRRIIDYNTIFYKIEKTKWPKCELKFNKETQLHMLLQLVNMPRHYISDISRDHVTGNIII